MAVPVGSPDRLEQIRGLCDDLVCLLSPEDFWAIGQFYADFTQVRDDEVIELLRGPHWRPSAQAARKSR